MLKKDNLGFGILIGLVLPAITFGILSLVALFVETGTIWTRPLERPYMAILALAVNVIPLRLYLVTWKFDKTGRGVLLITFILMLLYFLIPRFI
jgi:hypothetical protein